MVSDNATDKKIRLGEVAAALNVTPKLIRNWTASAEFDLVGSPDRASNKWREYSFLDVAHLAIAGQAIRYGFKIDEAHDFAGAALIKALGPLAEKVALAKMPGGAIEAVCRDKRLYLIRLSEGESLMTLSPPADEPPFIGACVIDLGMCVHLSFNSLIEMGYSPFDTGQPDDFTGDEIEALDKAFNPTAEPSEKEDAE